MDLADYDSDFDSDFDDGDGDDYEGGHYGDEDDQGQSMAVASHLRTLATWLPGLVEVASEQRTPSLRRRGLRCCSACHSGRVLISIVQDARAACLADVVRAFRVQVVPSRLDLPDIETRHAGVVVVPLISHFLPNAETRANRRSFRSCLL